MKRSKQREAILKVLCSTTSHPTADWIYHRVREMIPNISLGTVYRNLGMLSKNGDILKLDVGGEQSHYDGTVSPHNHFVCQSCQKVLDVNTMYDKNVDKAAQNTLGGSVNYHTLLFYGTCMECMENKYFGQDEVNSIECS